MKTTIIRLFSFILAFAIFAGCSKERITDTNPGDAKAKISKSQENAGPIYNYGSIKGRLNPAPSTVYIKAYSMNGFSVKNEPDPTGTFTINDLPPDIYNLHIVYVIERGEYSYTAYYDVWEVAVKGAGEVTEVGVINLPWNF